MEPFIIFINLSGLIIILSVYLLYKSKRINRLLWILFWIGTAIGLCWEIPLSILNSSFPPPLTVIILMIAASIWDGGLFLLGYGFVLLFCKKPHFQYTNWKELVVFLLYGQLSSLIVEIIAIAGGGWEYEVTPWNPLLFTILGGNITLIPQLIWFVAPIVFYLIIIQLHRDTLKYS